VAMNPDGTASLGLPRPQEVEDVADPKQRLATALRAAANLSGRREARFKKDFGRHRRQLLDQLDPDGLIGQVPAWRRLVEDVQVAVSTLEV
jgi:hypothetical protein